MIHFTEETVPTTERAEEVVSRIERILLESGPKMLPGVRVTFRHSEEVIVLLDHISGRAVVETRIKDICDGAHVHCSIFPTAQDLCEESSELPPDLGERSRQLIARVSAERPFLAMVAGPYWLVASYETRLPDQPILQAGTISRYADNFTPVKRAIALALNLGIARLPFLIEGEWVVINATDSVESARERIHSAPNTAVLPGLVQQFAALLEKLAAELRDWQPSKGKLPWGLNFDHRGRLTVDLKKLLSRFLPH